jgi:hypothetical protein
MAGAWFLFPLGEVCGVAKVRMRGKRMNQPKPLTLVLPCRSSTPQRGEEKLYCLKVTRFLLPSGMYHTVHTSGEKVRMRGNISTRPSIPAGKLLAITKTISYTAGVDSGDVAGVQLGQTCHSKTGGVDMIHEIRRIDVWSVVKISFFIYGIFGLIFGLFYAALLSMLGGFLSQMGGEFGGLQGLSGAVGIVGAFFMALFYAVLGAVVTAIFTWIYNLLAKGLGGIRFDLEQERAKVVIQPMQRSEEESEGMLGNQKYE